MRIIRPHGSSTTERDDSGERRRIRTVADPGHPRDVPAFAETDPRLVIAQWISVIDKIATKPKGNGGASREQHALRKLLGHACWNLMVSRGLLGEGDKRPLLALWELRLHPYGNKKRKPPPRKETSVAPPDPRGRWYATFFGETVPTAISPGVAAEAIRTHLHDAARRIHPGSKPKQKGLIAGRAKGIETSLLKRPPEPVSQGEYGDDAACKTARWSDSAIDAYFSAGDVAAQILAAAQAAEGNGSHFRWSGAAKILFEHWGLVFRDPSGAVMTYAEACKQMPEQVALHQAVRDCYRNLLKRSQRQGKIKGKGKIRDKAGVMRSLPIGRKGLLTMIRRQRANADLQTFIRLGRVIHYHAKPAEGHDDPAHVLDNWPDKAEIETSSMWLSDGQAHIKRCEAFVRIWRHALVLANSSLRQWAGMAQPLPARLDIFGGDSAPDQATAPKYYDASKFEARARLMFGARADALCEGEAEDRRRLLQSLMQTGAKLRHTVFHFKGLAQFIAQLEELGGLWDRQDMCRVRALVEADQLGRNERLREVLRGSHVESYLSEPDGQRLIRELTAADMPVLPLPRFNRLVQRANETGFSGNGKLPRPANQRRLEDPARLAQYVCLKLLYQGPFRIWLKQQRPKRWIKAAIDATNQRARRQAARGVNDDKAKLSMIAAKASRLIAPDADVDIVDLIGTLTAATASEMRVQNGYASNAEEAKEQAAYIGNFLSDVLVGAFLDYVKAAKLEALLQIEAEAVGQSAWSLDKARFPEPELDFADWQTAVYALLHMVPVQDAGRLLHQIAKWQVTSFKGGGLATPDNDRAQKLVRVLTLYLDMHDAKFTGGTPLTDFEPFRAFFEGDVFERVFPEHPDVLDDARLPKRGLREVMRFGNIDLLRKLKLQPITVGEWKRLSELDDPAEQRLPTAHQTRENLHKKWKDGGANHGTLTEDERQRYRDEVELIREHRYLTARINLRDLVQTHRLMMTTLGRLVDFAGLYERDLYFALLGVLHHGDREPSDVLTKEQLDKLRHGQTITAFGKKKPAAEMKQVISTLQEVGLVRRTDSRNKLAHLDAIKTTEDVDLTSWIWRTRELLVHDRKLFNAVTKAVIDLFDREGLILSWQNAGNNKFVADLQSRRIDHLGGAKIAGRRISEALLSPSHVKCVAALFSDSKIANGSVPAREPVPDRPG